jgi:amidase
LLDATAGPDVGDPYWAPPPQRPFLQEVGADPGRLKIAFTTQAGTDVAVHADCVQAVEDAAKLCAELGHEVEEKTLPLNAEMLVNAFSVLWSAGTASTLKILGAAREQVEPLSWALKEMSEQYSAADYILAMQTLQSVSREVARFFQDTDILLTPTLAEPPLPLGSFDSPPDNPLHGFYRAIMFACFTPVCNMTGQPGMSVPLFWNAQNLPVGSHFIGRFGDEATLFRLAAQLEEARPWGGRRPPIS